MPFPDSQQELAGADTTCSPMPPRAFVAARLPNFGPILALRSNASETLQQRLHTTIADLPSEILVRIMCTLFIRPADEPLHLRKRNRANSDLIIGIVVRGDGGLPCDTTTTRPLRPLSTNVNPVLPIILVCKAFYLAGTEAFYSHNTPCYSSLPHFQACGIRGLTSTQKYLVTRVRISIRFWPIMRPNAPAIHVPWEAQSLGSWQWDEAESYLRNQGDLLEHGFGERLKEVVVVANDDLYRCFGGGVDEARAGIERDIRRSWKSRKGVVKFEWSNGEIRRGEV